MSRTTTLVIGGCKSGKSAYALNFANEISAKKKSADKKIFVATSVPTDSEMQERVEAHKKEREGNWITIEEPILLPEIIEEHSNKADVILIDCLTLWISNLLFKDVTKKEILKNIQELAASLKKAECHVVLVSNEVGAGIVPENKLARLFRDIAGIANQKIAKAVANVVWTVAGIPVKIKE
ncbi:MAG: bifunctional adenosylcobinamide kinase/adenosylcobinamide-phosphate guanylyltransferase [Desulfobacteraceae bacterium]|nr:bifunctional adenosylcobinamide kinase/adenosylcobinamide-phosphate guanylyltransferase [Desulfobacteraceae bacterium]